MPARSRWRQLRAFRRSCTADTRQQHPPQRGISVVGSTSQTKPLSVNSTLVTRVNLIPSTVLSSVVARTVVRGSKVGVVTPSVPPRLCAFQHHRACPTLRREPAEKRRPRRNGYPAELPPNLSESPKKDSVEK